MLRLVFVLAGTQLIHHFDWVLPLFGLLLIYTALRLARQAGSEVHPEKSLVLRTARRLLPVSRGGHAQHGHAFLVQEDRQFRITPLLLVLLVMESTDLLFAIDSVPAVFGITLTRSSYSPPTSLPSWACGRYFLLAGVMQRFSCLHYGLAAVLAFVGANMIADYCLANPGTHLIATWAKLSVIAGLLGLAIVASMMAKRGEDKN